MKPGGQSRPAGVILADVRKPDLPELVERQRVVGVTLLVKRCAGQPERVNRPGRVASIVVEFHRGREVLSD